MKRLFSILVAVSLCFTLGFSSLTSSHIAQAKSQTFTGEEIFKGFVFGQGEIGQNLPDVFSKNMLKKLNTKEVKEFANLVVNRINKVDPTFFDELQKAVYNQDPVKVDELMKKAGEIVKNDLSKANKELKEMQQVAQRAGFETQNETYLYYYYIAAAGAVVIIILAAIDFTPIVAPEDFDREAAISSLIDAVN
jgi:SdpC family antimicrobial peptide